MPELPEVESRRAFAAKHLTGRTIVRASAAPDTIVYEGVGPRRLANALRNRKVLGVRRKGKHLWIELDHRPWPTLHFGMGGRFFAYEKPAERPRFWKLELLIESGLRLAMTNPRRLGRIRLLEDPVLELPISRLGEDPLHDLPPVRTLAARLSRRKAPIKAVLLDQAFLAGVGNWIADEVLYQARIDPRRLALDLKSEEVKRLRSRIRSVIDKAVAVDADSDRFPRSWLFHHRWGKDPEARTTRGERIRYITVGGRTTAWVPAIQR
jgi:formamidopyrimidine-DNA glycosylase